MSSNPLPSPIRNACSKLWPGRFTLLLAALGALGAALILAREASYGVGLSGDFNTYLSTARNLLAGEWFVQINDWPYLHWPPLYPLLLAAASLAVSTPYAVAGPLNAAVFGLTIFVAGQYLRQHIQHRFLVIGACLAIMLAIPLTRVASHAIAEAPFILFVTLALVQTSKFLDTGKWSDLIWAAVFAALAFLTRYIGVTLIITMLPLLLFQRGVAPWEKVKRIGLYVLIAALPVALWLVRNFLAHGRLHGSRNPSPWTLLEILDKFFSDLAGWVFLYLPPGDVRVAATVLTGIALLALAIFVGYMFIRSYKDDGFRGRWSPFYLFGGFALVYLVFLTASQSQTEILPLGDRYLSPLYIPLLFAAVFALDRLLSYARERASLITVGSLPIIRTIVRGGAERVSLPAVIAALGLSLWLSCGAALNAREIRRSNEGTGMGLAGPTWTNSEVLRYIREELADSPVFSNYTRAIYIYTDHANYHILPRGVGSARRDIENAADGAYVAWFYDRYGYDYSILQLPRLDPIVELKDGVILKVNRDYSAAAALRAVYESYESGEPVVRSNYDIDIYLGEGKLTYIKEPCAPADTQAKFFLHLIPANTNDLPDHRKQYGYDNLDFDLGRRSVLFDGKCMASVLLPEYPIVSIRTGQYIPGEGRVWEAEFPFIR